MNTVPPQKPSLATTGWRPRRLVCSTDEQFAGVGEIPPAANSSLAFVLEAHEPIDVVTWTIAHGRRVAELLSTYGAVLLRGFRGPVEPATLADLVRAVAGEPISYTERSSPRTELSPGVYTSTDYPADQEIFFHNENSYAATFPGVLAFSCRVPASEGGETSLVDCQAVLSRLSEFARKRFASDGVLYVRRHGPGLGVDWRRAYGTGDRDDVDRRLAAAGYVVSWRGEQLEARRIGPALVEHPVTGAQSWFNHAAFFHVSTLPVSLGRAMLEELGEEGLPNQSYYGDGTGIDSVALDEIRRAYRDEARWLRWEMDDVLFIDNIRVAHGRASYRGDRRILVSMARPCVTVGEGGMRKVRIVDE